MTIADKAVLVTGANRAAGQALVEEALRRGCVCMPGPAKCSLTNKDRRVTAVALDVTNAGIEIEAAAARVESLDILINNAGGVAVVFDGSRATVAIEQHLAVNLYGTYGVTRALLPKLIRSQGAIVNVCRNAAVAALPIIPAYSVSKAAAFSLSSRCAGRERCPGSRRAPGPVDTDMSREFDVPKASPESVARDDFDGVENGEDEIFPDPYVRDDCRRLAQWRRQGPRA